MAALFFMNGSNSWYSSREILINNSNSVLTGASIFTGQYWDEFSLTGQFLGAKPKILMLGLAAGGGVRPLLSSCFEASLVAVDCDEGACRSARKIYRDHFPDIHFEILHSSAESYLATTKERFDAIWVDIYNFDSYSSFLFDPKIIELLKQRLAENGKVFVNAYGIPSHLFPFDGVSPQAHLSLFFLSQFKTGRAFPYRRNMSLVFSDSALDVHSHASIPTALKLVDRIQLEIQNLRARHPIIMNPQPHGIGLQKFSDIDREMLNRWDRLVEGINGSNFGVKIDQRRDLIQIVQDPKKGRELLEAMLEARHSQVSFFPSLIAGQAAQGPIEIDWYLEWLTENSSALREKNPEQFIHFFLNPFAALVLSPSKRYQSHTFRLQTMVADTKKTLSP